MPNYHAIVGIDPSLCACGIASIAFRSDGSTEVKTQVAKTVPTDSTTLVSRYERIAIVVHAVEDVLKLVKADLIVLEGYSHGSNMSSKSVSIEVGALLRDTCLRYASTIEVPPARLKLFAARNGRASKGDMIRAVESEFGIQKLSEHEADALACAWLGAVVQGLLGCNIARQREIAEAVCESSF